MTKRDQIATLVGEAAADLALGANKWMVLAISASVPNPVLAVLSSALHVPQLWILIPICVITAIGVSVRGARLDNQAARVASAFPSRNQGMLLTVKSGGLRLWVWQQEIERAHQRLADESRQADKQADADLRKREWIALKQGAWNEYLRQHPQDAGQGG